MLTDLIYQSKFLNEPVELTFNLFTSALLLSLLVFITFYIIVKVKSRQLSIRYQELESRLKQTALDLQKNSLQTANLSMLLMTFDEKVEKFVKKTTRQKKDINQIRLDINQFHKEVKTTKQSLELLKVHFKSIDPLFFGELERRFPHISHQDVRLCALLRMNMNNKEISELMNITTNGVYQSKRRLKKKLGLKPDDKLRKFIKQVSNSSLIVMN
ncbi:MAG: hypothetical protein AAGA66_14605 [Bacteroidota bacterium]